MANKIDISQYEMMKYDCRHFVYPKDRILSPNSPMQIYIPNKVVMFKIMRACIGIRQFDDLWYYKDK